MRRKYADLRDPVYRDPFHCFGSADVFLPNEMNVMTKMSERFAVVIEISCLLCLIRRAIKKNAADWLEKIVKRPEKGHQREYLFIENYDAKRVLFSSIKIGHACRQV